MKIAKLAVASVALTLALGFTSFAGTWRQGESRPDAWWYDYGDGQYPSNTWVWLDGNKDGIAECYYFDKDGWLLTAIRSMRTVSALPTVRFAASIRRLRRERLFARQTIRPTVREKLSATTARTAALTRIQASASADRSLRSRSRLFDSEQSVKARVG